jgi:uncharacterized protein (DUF952 family)
VETDTATGYNRDMIYHVVALGDWLTEPDRPYTAPSLAEDGYIHCSPDEAVTLAVANAFYRETPGPLLALVIDEHKLSAAVRWEPGDPLLPGAVGGGPFPHVYGAINRDAVTRIEKVERDGRGLASSLTDWP